MFNTKIEVDRHVENCLKKCNDLERNLRCLAFSKLYIKVGAYEDALKYVSSYLHAKPSSAEGQNILGKILEKLGKKEAALEAYKTSLDIDPKQNNLVIKVCELLSSDDVNLDQSGAKYYCEKARSLDPNNPILLHLKEKLIAVESKDPNDVTRFLEKELEVSPMNVDIRIRLLRHLLQNNMIKDAYMHAYDIEQKHKNVFINNIKWYETLTEVLMAYKHENMVANNLTWEFWTMFISVLDKFVALSLDEHTENVRSSNNQAAALFNLDQNLKVASESLEGCPDKQFVQEFLMHFTGQICLHFTTYIFKQAKKEMMTYKEATNISLPLLFSAYNFSPADLQSLWVEHTDQIFRYQVLRWHREAAYRCSQVGHMILCLSKERKSLIIEKTNQSIKNLWRDQIFKKVFVTRDHQSKMKKSYFVNCIDLVEVNIKFPEIDELNKLDNAAQLVHPDSLHHHIWLGLGNKLSDMNCLVFPGMQYSTKNLSHCAAETLNILDIQSFIYCSILCAKGQIDESKHTIYYSPDKPSLLPASIMEQLGTSNQIKWFRLVHKYFVNQMNNIGENRSLIIHGIETVRCVGNHGLDVKLLVALARMFCERGKKLSKQSEVETNEARSELYWKTALPLLEKMKWNQGVSFGKNRLFECKLKEMCPAEIQKSIEDAKLFIGSQFMKKQEYEKALSFFDGLKDPYASYYQAQIYKSMADNENNQKRENVTSEMRGQHLIMLIKVRDCLYLTLDRLRDPNVDRKHPLNEIIGTEVEKVERRLSRIDPDMCANRNEYDNLSDENVSSIESENYNINSSYHISYTNGNYSAPVQSTPYRIDNSRREARPSPERLDAQLRQLVASKDTAINNILEQNKVIVDSHKILVEELKSFREAVSGLTSTVNDLKVVKNSVEEIVQIKKSIDELKHSVDELQSFRNLGDMIYEVRKEIAELKKDTTKIRSNQLSDEDLYVLDEDYSDYATANTNVSNITPSLYQNLGRLPPPAVNNLAYPSPAMYHGMYPLYPYGGLGLPQAGALPFGAEQQINDLRSIMSLQGATQPTLNQNAYQPPLPQNVTPALNIPSIPQASFATPGIQLPINNQIKDTSVLNSPFSSASTSVLNKAPPVNVVITSSDPLPSSKTTSAPQILSVTIPPQHLKGNQQKVHNYQIAMPTGASIVASTPSVLNQSPMPISTKSILSNVAPPIYSAVGDNKNNMKNSSLGLQIEKSLNESFNKSLDDSDKLNKSFVSIDEHDPCPDFKPIIPLPDEVPVNTGEENEDTLFSERARLYRYCNNEWKERGVGDFKILKNRDDQKTRILMRRDQVHKICANHYISQSMELLPKSERGYIWGACDYSEGKLITEKFCVQFKTPDLAKKFYNVFESAKTKLGNGTPKVDQGKETNNLGGFKFTSTPTFKPKEENLNDSNVQATTEIVKTSTHSPFASFSFAKEPLSLKTTVQPTKPTFSFTTPASSTLKTNDNSLLNSKLINRPVSPFWPSETSTFTTPSPVLNLNVDKKTVEANNKPLMFTTLNLSSSDQTASSDTFVKPLASVGNTLDKSTGNEDDFIPTAEFKPVIPLPDLVDVKTGEEGSEVLFECKARMLRFDKDAKEWKERGVGQMKILKDDIVRLVMRREQVLKLCCNQKLTKNLKFTQMKNNPCAFTWPGNDFSEGVIDTSLFAIRFKNEEIAKQFLESILNAQSLLDENNSVKEHEESHDKKIKSAEKTPTKPGWGDKFKSKLGSWECKNCYIINEPKVHKCVACDTPKSEISPRKEDDSQFCFGVATNQSGFGNAFKPKEGSWNCKSCYTNNDGDKSKCACCETLRDNVSSTTNTGSVKKIDFGVGDLKVSFGIPAKTTQAESTLPNTKSDTKVVGFGDAFKPKPGSWECKECYTRSTGDYCLSCDSPRDDTVPVKEKNKGIDLSTGGLTFKFGIPPAASAEEKKPATFSFASTEESKPTTFSFIKAEETKPSTFSFINTEESKPKTFSFIKTEESKPNTFSFTSAASDKKGFSFSTVPASKSEKQEEIVFGSPHKVGFEFTPRSPRRQSGGNAPDEESENSYYEEEEDNIYFKPVIPLPDKIEVTTGEEEEEILYCHRAKLFRLTDKEWKERGIGDLKILFKAENQKLRVLMRREQVHKICLNHLLTEDIDYKIKDNKTWLFSVADYSEGEIEHSSFCLRFKTQEIAEEFLAAVKSALKRISNDSPISCDDVVFVSETNVSKEEEDEAKRLLLPPKFMSYRQLPNCECEQCKREDILLSPLFNTPQTTTNVTQPSSFKTTSIFTPGAKPDSSIPKSEFLFGNGKSTPSFTPKENSTEGGVKDLLIKPSILGDIANKVTTNTSTNVSGSLFSLPKTTFTSNIFDNSNNESTFAAATSANTIFGGIPNTTPFKSVGSTNTAGPLESTPNKSQVNTPQTTPSSFSGNLFASKTTTSSNIFGGGASNFEGKKPDSAASFSFGSLLPSTKNSSSEDFVFGAKSDLSFASLSTFGKPFEINTGENVFASLGAGQPVFSKSAEVKEQKKDEEGEGDDNYDPHYDPIVALPDAIVVSTGEEDETILFNERGKVYRYDKGEWKERGVGQVKILHHPVNNTYRLLLRREQVHKLVLNLLITPNMELKFQTSKSWFWQGYNFIENENLLETLAVRFKSEELAARFGGKVNEIIELKKAERSDTSAANISDVSEASEN